MATRTVSSLLRAAAISPLDALKDCLFLTAIVWLAALPYLTRLGFYSDDWSLLATFKQSADQSLIGLFKYGYGPYEISRPVYVMFFAILYRVFDLHPFGYHVVNQLVFASSVCLLYLTLRELRLARLVTLCVPLVFATLPNYSTNRFWIAACHGFLSLALCFLSIYSDTRALQTSLSRFWFWRLLGFFSLLGSILTYELVIPLLLFNSLLMVVTPLLPGPKSVEPKVGRRLIAALTNVGALVGVSAFSATMTAREVITSNFAGHARDIARGAFVVTLGRFGAGLPHTVIRALSGYHDATLLLSGVAIGGIIFGYLYRVAASAEPIGMTRRDWSGVILFGLLLIGVGYAIFFATPEIVFTASGIGNRTALVATLGLGTAYSGVLGLAATYFRSGTSWRNFFCSMVTLLCICGFVITTHLSSYWASAYRRENAVLADIREHVRSLPAGSTLILDGVCPYDGPAIVFESNWDLAGALQLAYKDQALRADVVTPNLSVTDRGLTTLLYGHLSANYPYGNRLMLYHFGQKKIYPLADAASARRYFQEINPDRRNGCPEGIAGKGIEIYSRNLPGDRP